MKVFELQELGWIRQKKERILVGTKIVEDMKDEEKVEFPLL